MTHIKVQNQSCLDQSIWWVLATIEGEPKSAQDLNEMTMKNCHYWNGLMRPRTQRWNSSVQRSLQRSYELPVLQAEDHLKIRAALDARGFEGVAIPTPDSPIDFSHFKFPEFASFAGFIFGGQARFDNATFTNSSAVFAHTKFVGPVTFDGTLFAKDAIFLDAEFIHYAVFRNALFAQSAVFTGSRFHSNADFSRVRFLCGASFDKTKFSRRAHFAWAIFERQAEFQSAEFKGPTYFQRSTFKDDVPSFFESTLFEFTDWHGTAWPKLPRDRDAAREQVQYYECLVSLMNKLEKPRDRHFFFRKEMRAQRRAESVFSLTRVLNLIYELVCDYGNGLGRVATLWLAHILSGGAIIWLAKVFADTDSIDTKTGRFALIQDFFQAVGISFSNAHALLGLNRGFLEDTLRSWSDVPFLNTIGSVQTVIGVVILFFLILTVRNRFRMQ